MKIYYINTTRICDMILYEARVKSRPLLPPKFRAWSLDFVKVRYVVVYCRKITRQHDAGCGWRADGWKYLNRLAGFRKSDWYWHSTRFRHRVYIIQRSNSTLKSDIFMYPLFSNKA